MELADKTFLLNELTESAVEFEAAVAGVPVHQWLQRPADSEWSAAECGEHVIVVEQRIYGRVRGLEQIADEPFDAEHSHRKDLLLKGMPNREQRVQAPEALLPKGVYSEPASLLDAFREARATTIALAATYPDWLRGRFAEHPILKKLDGHQWLLAVAGHSRRHAAQIREITERVALVDNGN